MTFLVIDTSGDYAVLVLADEEKDGAVLGAAVFEGRRTLSRRLMGQIDYLLSENGLTVSDLTAFGVGLGPGSFTGVRIGVTTIKTLAQVTGKPLIGVGTLDSYAAVWHRDNNPAVIIPILPSRHGQVYAAVYRAGERMEEPFAASFEEISDRIQEFNNVIVCGQSSLIAEGKLGGRLGISLLNQPWTPPEGLAYLAALRLSAGNLDNPSALVPLYVVAPSISTPKDPTILPTAERGRA